MFEVYVLVQKKKPALLGFFTIFFYVMGVLATLLTALGSLIAFPFALGGLLLGYFLSTRNFEFEYSFFDNEIKFAKIINKNRRKNLGSCTMEEVLMIAPTGDPKVYNYENDNTAKVKRLNSQNAGAKVYVIAAKGTDGLQLIYIEPDEEFLDAICTKYAYKVKR